MFRSSGLWPCLPPSWRLQRHSQRHLPALTRSSATDSFPATLAIDDPGVNDELALPTVSISKTGDVPSFKQLDVSGEFAKRITEDFGVSFAPTWSRLYAPGGPNLTGARGFQNLETTFKYRLFKSAEHEFVHVGRT